MVNTNNSGTNAAITVISPEFSLLKDFNSLYNITADAFATATPKERELLFRIRRFLDTVVGDYKTFPIAIKEYIDILFSAKEYLKTANVPKDIHVVFPGIMEQLPASDESIIKLLGISENITVNFDSFRGCESFDKFIGFITRNGNDKLSLNMITDSYLSVKDTEPILNIWKSGINLTLCRKNNILTQLKSIGSHTKTDFDIYDGKILIPGKTVVKSIPVEFGAFEKQEDPKDFYRLLKAHLREIIDTEQSEKYSQSSKGKFFRRKNISDENLAFLGILYEDFIIGNRISHADRGEFDIINFSVTSARNLDRNESYKLKCLSAACKYLEGLYRFKPLSSFKDIRYADDMADLKNAIKQHTDVSQFMNGGALLDLSVDKISAIADSCLITSFVNEFFGYGGTMIKIKFV